MEAITTIPRVADVIVLFALCIFISSALSQDIHKAVESRNILTTNSLAAKDISAVNAKHDRCVALLLFTPQDYPKEIPNG